MLRLHKYTNGSGQLLASDPGGWTSTAGQWATWGLEVDGPRIRAYINGVLKFEYVDTDNPHLTGYAGLWSHYNPNVEFDDQDQQACK